MQIDKKELNNYCGRHYQGWQASLYTELVQFEHETQTYPPVHKFQRKTAGKIWG